MPELKIPVVSKSPEEAAGHFGWLRAIRRSGRPSFVVAQRLGWRPTQAAGIDQTRLDHMNWSAV